MTKRTARKWARQLSRFGLQYSDVPLVPQNIETHLYRLAVGERIPGVNHATQAAAWFREFADALEKQ